METLNIDFNCQMGEEKIEMVKTRMNYAFKRKTNVMFFLSLSTNMELKPHIINGKPLAEVASEISIPKSNVN